MALYPQEKKVITNVQNREEAVKLNFDFWGDESYVSEEILSIIQSFPPSEAMY